MKRKVKILAYSVLSFILLISSLAVCNIDTNAKGYASRYAWRDDNGNIILKTEDHQRTSDICYQTLGWTITRCALGTQNAIEEEYITVRFNGSIQDVPIGNGYTTSAFVVSEGEFLSKIAGAGAGWIDDVKSNQPCWLRFDAIMCTWDYSQPEYAAFSGYMDSDSNQAYVGNPMYQPPSKGMVYDKFTKEQLEDANSLTESYNSSTIFLCHSSGEEIHEKHIS